MNIIKLSKKELISFLIDTDNYYGQGTYGILKKYNETTLLKIYYKDIIETYMSLDVNKLDKEIDELLKIEKQMKKINHNYEDKLQHIKKIYSHLKNSKSSSLIKGVAIYKRYPIGIFLENYKDYLLFKEVYTQLNNEQKIKILNKTKELIIDLFNNNIYPTDIKENNILINPVNLDIKVIDLDGTETRVETKDHIINYPYIKKNCINDLEKMFSRLNK